MFLRIVLPSTDFNFELLTKSHVIVLVSLFELNMHETALVP